MSPSKKPSEATSTVLDTKANRHASSEDGQCKESDSKTLSYLPNSIVSVSTRTCEGQTWDTNIYNIQSTPHQSDHSGEYESLAHDPKTPNIAMAKFNTGSKPHSIKVMSTNKSKSRKNDPETPLPSPISCHPGASEAFPQITCNEIDRCSPRSDAGFDEKTSTGEEERERISRSEIQNIMEQFSEEGHGPGHEEIMSPRLDVAGSRLGGSIQHPPRKSSLGPSNSVVIDDGEIQTVVTPPDNQFSNSSNFGPMNILKHNPDSAITQYPSSNERYKPPESSMSPSLHRPPPPEPESEPNLPFDFHRFLEQLRHKTADPVAKFLRSFLQEFGKKQWMVHEQVKIISDFLAFISNKMAQCEVWNEVSDAEFDNAREGMEKLVMNRLYTQTFSPAISPPQPIPGSKSRRKGAERLNGPGRRGQHQEDVERDEILAQKVKIYGWIREEHLDIPPVPESGKNFLLLAQKELLKIKTYRAPRDKIICVLNCCKVIFGLLKHSKSDSSADSFMPLLIYVVLQANPEHLVSNVQYILRFRNQDKLAGEAGYYLSSLLGAVHFIENLDRTTLTVSDEDFEKNVEAAVSAIAEKHQSQADESAKPSSEQASQNADVALYHLKEGGHSNQKLSPSSEQDSGEAPDEKAAMGGLLRTIQRPLSTISWMFTEEGLIPQDGLTRISPTAHPPNSSSSQVIADSSQNISASKNSKDLTLNNRRAIDDLMERDANAQAAEIRRIQRIEYSNIADTLANMFPDLDRDIIRDLVTQKQGRVCLAVDACLALSSE